MPFEGVEKRLELVFTKKNSLRETLTRQMWEKILKPVNCAIEKELPTPTVNSYLLSASSLFVFNDRVVIKTCGNTEVFEAIKGILGHARQDAIGVKYTRGEFLWSEKQPEVHRVFQKESHTLVRHFTGFGNMVTEDLGNDESNKFHFVAAESSTLSVSEVKTDGVTVEILMKGLDKIKASAFTKSGAAGRMKSASGIDRIFPESTISEYEFTPCGYSMNGIQGSSVYTIHVTPEDAFSFASFEAYRYEFKGKGDFNQVVKKVLDCFGPSQFIVTVHLSSNSNMDLVDLEVDGRVCKFKDVKDLGKWGTMIYYSY